MIVTIWRHGEAGQAVSDHVRELTGQGADDISYGAHRLCQHLVDRDLGDPDLVLHSRWVRTTQSAEIISAAFSHAPMRESEALIPGSDPAGVDDALAELIGNAGTVDHIILVSHQPLVSRLVERYLDPLLAVPPLSPGGFCTLTLEVAARGCGRLLFWALPPTFEAEA